MLKGLLGHKSRSRVKASTEGGDGGAAPVSADQQYAREQVRGQVHQEEEDQQQQDRATSLDVPSSSSQHDNPPRSPGGGAWTTSYTLRQPHHLLTQVFPEPEHIASFADALRIDLGQQEIIPPQLLLSDDYRANSAASSPSSPSSPASLHHSSFTTSLWNRLSFSAKSTVDHSNSKPSRRNTAQSSARSPSDPLKNSNIPSSSRQRSATDNKRQQQQQEQQQSEQVLLQQQTAEPAQLPSLTRTSHPRNVGRISAASDFAPVYERVQKRSLKRLGKRKVDSGTREGILYQLLRFPLLLCVFLVIAIEFSLYVLVRQLVNIVEYAIAFRGQKGRLRKRLRAAQTWEEWKTVALELDGFLGLQRWKEEDGSGLYDWILVKKVASSLRSHRTQGDADKLIEVLELCLKNNFAGVENFKLFSQTYFGSKNLIERFAAEVEESLRFIRETDKISVDEKRRFYRRVSKNMGKSALCLSGGGSFGYYHIGVVRALLDANLLPTIISGTSAGGLIAALACTRTDEELKEILVPALADRITACEEPLRIWAVRAYRTGARFDTVAWASKCTYFTRGSTTFLEAYRRTGKVLNVSVIPADRHSPVKLLNHLTAPNCIIWSALLASAAVPGLLNPVCLMQKTKDGEAIPYNLGHRFKDGSLRVDIPLEELHMLFQVNYPIVSQVNPHIHLFHFAPQGTPGRPVAHRRGKGWRGGFLLSAIEHVLKLHLAMNFKIIRDLDLLPRLLGTDWSSIFLQRFTGAVTIIPKTRFWDWIRILSDPDRKELARMLRVSQSVSFPKLHMIENRMRLENEIEAGRRACRRAARAQALAQANSSSNNHQQQRPPLNAMLSYLGSDTDHDDFSSMARKRSSQGEGLIRVRGLGSLDSGGGGGGAFSNGLQTSAPATPDEAMPLRNRLEEGGGGGGGGTDEDGGTSEDGDHKRMGRHHQHGERPEWLDRGDDGEDSENEDDEQGAEEHGDENGRRRNGASSPPQRSGADGEDGREPRVRTWSFARASAALRNTFSPSKGSGSGSMMESAAARFEEPAPASPTTVQLEEEETSSGEDEAEA
ncbi:hypothetical protein OC845_005136 [Tilletia horrida]|nr:hypothetical protein OC845_005136 [Tilletia horrida]